MLVNLGRRALHSGDSGESTQEAKDTGDYRPRALNALTTLPENRELAGSEWLRTASVSSSSCCPP